MRRRIQTLPVFALALNVATFTSRFRSVRLFSQQACVTIQRVGRGLQIREDRFDSGTRLHYLADLARGFSTFFSTFPFRACSVPGRFVKRL